MAAKKKKKAIIGRPREKRRGSPFDVALGKRIKDRKAALNMTDKALAAAIGRSVSQVYRYQAGDIKCDAEIVFKIAEALDCEFIDLIGGRGGK